MFVAFGDDIFDNPTDLNKITVLGFGVMLILSETADSVELSLCLSLDGRRLFRNERSRPRCLWPAILIGLF